MLIGVSSLLSLPEGLHVERIELQGDLLAIAIVSVLPSSRCPRCSQASSQVHSWYQRTLRDVPCAGRQVVLHLSVRKFFCRNPDCAHKIFTERLPTFAEPWAQVTKPGMGFFSFETAWRTVQGAHDEHAEERASTRSVKRRCERPGRSGRYIV